MILEQLQVAPDDFEQRTGWSIKPQGACKGEMCVPLRKDVLLDVRVVADRLGMPLVADEPTGLWSLGPEASGQVLTSVEAPDLALPDLDGRVFHLRSLRGSKVLLLAWASW
ncbi:MAG: hypothetical protein JOZ87_32130 [Chloroflexi bacterium]|nr:hypothetical protein [Chloroflexota bacterium]